MSQDHHDALRSLHDPGTMHFASDNYAGVHPEVMDALLRANGGHQISYGEDDYTEHLQSVMRAHFGDAAVAFPVFNGTGANVLSLQAVLPAWGGAICAESAHANCDEGGAPEKVGRIKLLTVPTRDGKLTPDLVDRQAFGRGDEHRVQPLVVTITESTEYGTVYTADEIAAICAHAHQLGMLVHCDGSRLANAAAHLGAGLGDLTTQAGVDLISLGATKNGAMLAECVVVTGAGGRDVAPVAQALTYLRKTDMQLGSKMRFISAQLIALYEGDLWRRSASQANAMARRLADGVTGVNGVRITQAVQANSIFAVLDADMAARLRERYRFYDWPGHPGEIRWMCAFDTTEADVDAFVAAVRDAAASR